MASWLKAKLFGRQLSYGSENEDPQSFEEAFQQQVQTPPEMLEQQVGAVFMLAVCAHLKRNKAAKVALYWS